MKVIDKAKAHFNSLDIKEIEIPEWSDDGEILKIYAKPLTLAEMSKLQKYAKDDDVALMAYCLIHKALDAEGNKVFDIGDVLVDNGNAAIGTIKSIGSATAITLEDGATQAVAGDDEIVNKNPVTFILHFEK